MSNSTGSILISSLIYLNDKRCWDSIFEPLFESPNPKTLISFQLKQAIKPDMTLDMKSSLLEMEVNPYQDTTTSIILDETDEYSHLRTQCINEEDFNYFQQLPSEVIRTKFGNITVAIQGDRNKKGTALLTLHDIGQDHIKCFQSYFCFHQTKPLLNHFTVYHINFPGQEDNAEALPEDYVFPTMEQIADVVSEVIDYFSLKKTVCFGVGAGANVFTRLGLKRPAAVECLVLLNGTSDVASWMEWGYEKMSVHYLKTKGMTLFTQDYLVWHYFGKVDERTNLDLVGLVRDQLHRIKHPRNLALFIESYAKRDAIKVARPVIGQSNLTSLKCSTLIITGDGSPWVDDTVALNSKLDPSLTSWMKISDATSLVLEEQPTSVTNALILFLQGHGYALKVTPPTLKQVSVTEIAAPPAIC